MEQDEAKAKAQAEYSEKKRLEMLESTKSKPNQEIRTNSPKRAHISIAERLKTMQHAN